MKNTMSFKVKIKDFQKIKGAELSFDPGLTIIVGATNNGKTSVLRAIEAALFNKSVDSSISHGSDCAVVNVSYNNNSLVWERNKTKASKTYYKLNDDVMVKVGRGQLDEIRDAFNIKEINLLRTREKLNFWKQMRFPFLLDRTPAQLFEFIVMSSEETNLAQVLKLMNSDMKDMSSAVLVVESVIDEYKNKISEGINNLKRFKNYPKISKEIMDEDFQVKSLSNLENLCDKCEEINLEIENNRSELSKIDKSIGTILKLISESDKCIAEISLLEKNGREWKRALDEKNDLCNEREDIDNEIRKLGRVSKEDIDSYIAIEKDTNKLSIMLSDYDVLKEWLERETQNLAKIEEEIKSIDSEFRKFKICPLCGQTLKK